MAKSKTATPAKAAAKPVAKPAAKPAPVAAKAAPKAKAKIDPEVRLRMIAEAAYYIAEKRGFIHGHHDSDWAQAVKQIDSLLAK